MWANIQRVAVILFLLNSVDCLGAITVDAFTIATSVDVAHPWTQEVRQNDILFDGDADRLLAARCVCGRGQIRPTVTADIVPENSGLLEIVTTNMPSLETRLGHSGVVLGYSLYTAGVVMDLTEGGENDAVRIDFAYSRGPTAFQNLRVSGSTDETLVQSGLFEPFPITEYPFSRFFPLEDFRDRIGQEVPGAFESIINLQFEFQTLGNPWFGSPQPDDRGWELGVRRISFVEMPTDFLACDADADGDCDGADLDLLYTALNDFSLPPPPGGGGASPPASRGLDLDGNGVVDTDDIDDWLMAASDSANPAKLFADDVYIPGDVSLDGNVDSTDLGLLLNHFGTESLFVLPYQNGNLNGDRIVDSRDLGILLNNFGATSTLNSTLAVPEPTWCWMPLLLAVLVCVSSRNPRRN